MPDAGLPDEEKRSTLRQFAALGAIGPFVSLSEAPTQSDEPERRAAIRGYLAASPGIHFSKLRDDLDLGTGETQYHVRRLVEERSIESVKDGEYRRLFPAGQFDDRERVALSYLRRQTPRAMLLRLLERPDVSPAELADEIDVSRSTISRAAAELETVGLLERDHGTYTVRDAEILIALLVRYADSFDADTAAFADHVSNVISWRGEE